MASIGKNVRETKAMYPLLAMGVLMSTDIIENRIYATQKSKNEIT